MNTTTKIASSILCGAALACSMVPALAETLHIQVPAVFGPNVEVIPRIREECQLEQMVGTQVLQQVQKKYADTEALAAGGALDQGRVLKLTILEVRGVGGGGWSGSKSLMVRGELLQDGKLVRTALQRDGSRGGLLGPGRSTCSIFETVAESIGAQFTAWLAMVEQIKPTPAAETATVGSPAQSAP